MTDFQEKVYAACRQIPKGKVATYGWIAKKIDCKSSQAIGGALKRNPDTKKTPCHRVVAANGRLHGYKGSTKEKELSEKKARLESEGVKINGNQVSADCMLSVE